MRIIGFFVINGTLDSAYKEVLEQNKYKTVMLTKENFLDQLPKLSGIVLYDEQEHIGEICQYLIQVKERSSSCVWVLTNKTNNVNRLLYLQLGAVGCFDSILQPGECYFVIHNFFEHVLSKNRQFLLSDDSFNLIPENHSIQIDGGNEVLLTRSEYQIMELLVKTPNKTISSEDLFALIGKNVMKTQRNTRIANIIFSIRKKIAQVSSRQIIKTVHGRGYMFITAENEK